MIINPQIAAQFLIVVFGIVQLAVELYSVDHIVLKNLRFVLRFIYLIFSGLFIGGYSSDILFSDLILLAYLLYITRVFEIKRSLNVWDSESNFGKSIACKLEQKTFLYISRSLYYTIDSVCRPIMMMVALTLIVAITSSWLGLHSPVFSSYMLVLFLVVGFLGIWNKTLPSKIVDIYKRLSLIILGGAVVLLACKFFISDSTLNMCLMGGVLLLWSVLLILYRARNLKVLINK